MIRAALALTLALSSTALFAAPADDEADMRCFLVSADMADSKDAETKNAGSVMMFYFLGRLDGRNPNVDLKQLLVREAERMSDADKEKLLVSCSGKVEQRGKQLEALGS